MAGRYSMSPGFKVTRSDFANWENSVVFFVGSSGSHVANGTSSASWSRDSSSVDSDLLYVAGFTSFSLTQEWHRGGSSTKCFLPMT